MAEEGERSIEVSVIVPAHRLDETLERCLRSLQAQTFPAARREIIVVLDGIGPGTFFEPFDLRVVQAPRLGPASARNRGVREAAGPLLAFTDSDCLVAPDWLEQLAGSLTEEDVAGVGGSQLSPADDSAFGQAVQRFFEAISFVGGYTRAHARVREVAHNPTCNAMIRRSAFEAVGGFAPGLWPGEDLDLDLRMRRRGYRLLYNPAARVHHYRPASLAGFARMMESYGRCSGGYLTRKHGFFRGLCYVPFLMAFLLAALLALSLLHAPLAVAVVLAGLAGAAAWFAVRMGGPARAPMGLLLLATTLLVWNLGYLRGLFHRPAGGQPADAAGGGP
jgi:succinoglycan biosynthesis protein ExoA